MTKPNSPNIKPDSLPRLLRPDEAAEVLGVSLKTVRRRIETGALPAVRDGRLIRVHPNDLERYITARRNL